MNHPKSEALQAEPDAARFLTNLSLWGWLLLGVFLLVPFFLRHTVHWEPYPAILFPTGAGRLAVNGTVVSYPRFGLTAILDNGELLEVSPHGFFEPVPDQYFPVLAPNHFFVTDDLPPEKLQELNTWLYERLQNAGIENATGLTVSRLAIEYDSANQTELSREVTDEYTFDLSDVAGAQ